MLNVLKRQTKNFQKSVECFRLDRRRNLRIAYM